MQITLEISRNGVLSEIEQKTNYTGDKKVGDETEFALPNGEVSKVKILEIKKYEGELELRKF